MALVHVFYEYILILELNLEAAPACLTGIAARSSVYMSMMFSMQEDPISIRRRYLGRLFGRCIASIRQTRGRSVEEAARLAGMEISDWMAVEAGRVPADRDQLHPMADALGLSHDKIGYLTLIFQGAWE
jgi:hypothetical protein